MFDHLNISKIIERACLNGAKLVNANGVKTESIHVSFSNINDIKIQSSLDIGVGYDISVGDKSIFISTNSFEDILDTIVQNIQRLKRKSGSSGVEVQKNQVNTKISRVNDNIISKRFNGDVYEFSRYIRDELLDNLSEDIVYNCNIIEEKEYRNFLSSAGSNIYQDSSSVELKLLLSKSLDYGEVRKYITLGGLSEDNFNLELLIDKLNSASAELSQITRFQKITSGNYKVLFGEEPTWTLIHESIGHAVEADRILTGESYVSNLLGQKIANSGVTVIDDPLIKSSGWMEFDDEGTKCSGTVLVENGLLTEYLHNKETAEYFHQLPTGNARTNAYYNVPMVRQSNLFIEPQNIEDQELVETLKNGLFIDGSSHGSTQIQTGDFRVFSEFFYQVENGEITNPVLPGFIMDNALSALTNLTHVGKIIENYPAYCQKEDQEIRMGMISPKCIIEDIGVYFT